jgi:prepilin-type N-terminal cleavage/methylation domain-containing protein
MGDATTVSAAIERGADSRQQMGADAGRATASLPGAIIGGVHASPQLPAVRSGLELKGSGFRVQGSVRTSELNPEPRTLNPRGFTLTEVLIVIALIVLLLALAVPAFNFITGGRSLDAGQNVVSAMLGRARARAIETERYAGVAFYLDPKTGRTTMTIVVQRDGDANVFGEDPYDNYKGWNKAATYAKGQEVIAIIKDGDPNSKYPDPNSSVSSGYPLENRLRVQKFVSKQNANTNHHPPDQTAAGTPPEDVWWGPAEQKFIDFDIDAESETVPVGVGVQLVNDTKGNANADRYVRTGVILFDGRGRFDSIPYAIRASGAWGQRLGLTTDIDLTPSLYSQLGVALYDQAAFKDQPGDVGTENDTLFNIPNYGSGPTGEPAEETWLDNNSLLLSINRYNGTLVRGE